MDRAVSQRTADQQPELLGMPTAPARVLDLSHALKVAVQGPLQVDATVRQRSSGVVVIDLVIGQHVEHHPEARLLIASLPVERPTFASSMDAALAKARDLLAGTVVVVVGQGLEAGHRHGTSVFRLLHTTSAMRLVDIPHQEPSHAH